MKRDEVIEIMARAVCGHVWGMQFDADLNDPMLDATVNDCWTDHTSIAGHIAKELEAAGLAIVPVEPTSKMCFAGANEQENGDGLLHRRKWRAMIAADEKSEEAEKYVKQRQDSIEKGARRTGERFRL